MDILTLQEAVAQNVHDGDVVAMEGFTHLIPFAAGHELIRQAKRDLTLIRMTPDVIYDQLIGAGSARKIVFSWGGNPGVGSLHRMRDAIENDWPHAIDYEEYSHAAMVGAYEAGAAGMPCAIFKGLQGSDLIHHNDNIRFIACPYTGESLTAVPAIRPDVTIIHAQVADRSGNVLIEGITGVQKEAVLSARRAVVTVEEIVDELQPPSLNSVVVPGWAIDAVVHAPGGAHPSYAHGYYERDNKFYIEWSDISRDRGRFTNWIEENVTSHG